MRKSKPGALLGSAHDIAYDDRLGRIEHDGVRKLVEDAEDEQQPRALRREVQVAGGLHHRPSLIAQLGENVWTRIGSWIGYHRRGVINRQHVPALQAVPDSAI